MGARLFRDAVSHLPAASSCIPSVSLRFVVSRTNPAHPFGRTVRHIRDGYGDKNVCLKCSNWALRRFTRVWYLTPSQASLERCASRLPQIPARLKAVSIEWSITEHLY
jgi:hypothetical protein